MSWHVIHEFRHETRARNVQWTFPPNSVAALIERSDQIENGKESGYIKENAKNKMAARNYNEEGG